MKHNHVLVVAAFVTFSAVSCTVEEVTSTDDRFRMPDNELKSEPQPQLAEQIKVAVTPVHEANKDSFESANDRQSPSDQESTHDPASRHRQADRRVSENWPRFRGPNGAGVSTDTGLPLKWDGTNNIVWKTELPGPGSSSPIVWGDHVYITCYTGYGVRQETPGDQADLKRHLICVDRKRGDVHWADVMHPKGTEVAYKGFVPNHGYASNTPVADATGVFVYCATAGLAAYSHHGQKKWHTYLGPTGFGYGSGSSPILHGDLVILNAAYVAGAIIGLDKRTGEEVWRRKTTGCYTPALAKIGKRHELIVSYRATTTGDSEGKVTALDPSTGATLWECSAVDAGQNCSPVVHDGVVYISGGKPGETMAIRCGGRGDVTDSHVLWRAPMANSLTTLVYFDGHLYGVNTASIIFCASAESGEVIYRERLQPASGFIFSSPVIADGKIFYVSRENGTYVVAARPAFQQLAHNSIDTDKSVFNATPAIHRRHLILRSRKFLYCIGHAASD